ncbi:MAG: B12-binding domain-containing radical SAM protein [Thermoplasmatales archaeon]|nr:B12-binding domain-containing radical SAM protein [Thermoplasmatales archaeon]
MTSKKPNILLMVSPNYSIKLLEEEIQNIKSGSNDFTKSVDWRISAPIGILYIAGNLRKHGYNVEIYDLHRAFYECRERGYFKEKNLSDFFKEHYEKILVNNNFDVLGISCLFNVASTTVEEMGYRCKKISPNTKIVLGGHYPTIKYKDILQKDSCDYIILGEAEEEFVWLLDHLNDSKLDDLVNSNPHIVDKKCKDNPNKSSAIIEELDTLPQPAWDLLPHTIDYIEKTLHADRIGTSSKKKNKSAGILSTRGCPMRCTFCAAHGVHGRKIRAHSIEYMMKHIDWLVDNYDVNHLLIEDDMFNYKSERTTEFCKTIYKKYQNRFTIEFPNGLAVWNLTDETVKNLKKIGLKNVTIAVESGNAFVQKNILKKNLDLEKIKDKVNLLKKYKINIRGFYIIGFVDETLDMMHDTIQYAEDLNINWSEIKVFTPLAGSEMYDLSEEKGYLSEDTSEHIYGRCSIMSPDFTPEQVEELRYDANIRINFLNNYNLRQGEFEDAQKIFLKLLNVYPNHLFAQWGLWQALEGQGKKEEAKKALERLKELSKTNEKNQLLLEKYNIKITGDKQ